MFNPKPFKDVGFWFTKGISIWIDRRSDLHVIEIDFEEKEGKLETTDILETVTGTPSIQKAIREEENKLIEKEEKAETPTLQIQQVNNSFSTLD